MIRRELLTEDLLNLPARVEALAARVEALAARTGQRFAELAEAMASGQRRLGELAATVTVLGGAMGELPEAAYEREVLAAADGVEAAVGAAFGAVRRLTRDELTGLLGEAVRDGRLAPGAARAVHRANGIFEWDRGDGAVPVLCVVEASITSQPGDVERAARRAAELAQAGFQTVPIVLGMRPAAEIQGAIDAKRVVWHRGESRRL